MRILDRYVVTETLGPFLFGSATFMLLFISADALFRVARLMVEEQASFFQAMEYLFLNLPNIVVLTFPMAVLLACLLAFGRLSGDSEIVAMKAGGISFYRIAAPGLVLAFLIFIFALLINELIVPEANYRARNMLVRQLTKEQSTIRENIVNREITSDGIERIIYSRRLDITNGTMYNVVMQDYVRDKRVREVYSDQARWERNTWFLQNPRTLEFDEYGEVVMSSISSSAVMPLDKEPSKLGERERLMEEMNRGQLRERIAILARAYSATSFRELNKLTINYNQRVALPFTCFVFGLFGIPLGVRPHRTSTSIGLGLSLIFIFIYYVLMTLGVALGENGVLRPTIAAWLPNITFAGVGSWLLYRTGRI
jgi:lipopolysaccharide export system permease protein